MTGRQVAGGCGIVAAVVLLVAGCGLAAVISELPAGNHPEVDFEGDEISAARSAAVATLEADLATVVRRSELRQVGGHGRRDRCEAGQDNFTRQDRYAYSCRMEIRALVAFPGPFRESAARLGEALLEGNCPGGTDTDRALVDWQGVDVQDVRSSSGDCTPGASFGAPAVERWLPARPTADELERAQDAIDIRTRCWSSVYREHCEVKPLDLRDALASVPSDADYVAVLVANESYFRVPWECDWPASWFAERCRS